MKRLAVLAAVAAAGAMVVAPIPAAATHDGTYPRPGSTQRVSVGDQGQEANWHSAAPAMSTDGRYMAFESVAWNLVPGVTNQASDVFVRDRAAGATERVSVPDSAAEARGASWGPAISADGRYVAFTSDAWNLVSGDSNGATDVFVRDRVAGTTERVSVAADDSQGNGGSWDAAISADGRYVAFASDATNLVPGDSNGATDVFVRDRVARTTERVSVASDGSQADLASSQPAISADGSTVAFVSAADFGDDRANGHLQVFVHDRVAGTTERASASSDDRVGDHDAAAPSASADGRYVAFSSRAANLVPHDSNRLSDVFVRDRAAGITERVSVTSFGGQANSFGELFGDYSGGAFEPAISADGRYVAFSSDAANLVLHSGNFATDVYLHDRRSGGTERVSLASDGSQASASSAAPAITDDGRLVAFRSGSAFVPDDTNGWRDIYLRDRGPTLGPGWLQATTEGGQVTVTGAALLPPTLLASASSEPAGEPARALGADLERVELWRRVEQGDVLVRFRLPELPGVRGSSWRPAGLALPVVAGSPGVLHALELTVGGVAYEIRAMRAAASELRAPLFGLYRCDSDCEPVEWLRGAYGTTGNEILVSLPLDELGLDDGGTLAGLRAYTALADTVTGPLHELDAVDLGDVVAPGVTAALVAAESSAPVAAANVQRGELTATISRSAVPDGGVLALLCLGEACGTAPVPLDQEEY